jgi:hypothetical protein
MCLTWLSKFFSLEKRVSRKTAIHTEVNELDLCIKRQRIDGIKWYGIFKSYLWTVNGGANE